MLRLKGSVIWLVFILAETINGAIRELWLVPVFGDTLAHQISFGSGAILILTIATLFIPWLQVTHLSQLLRIGILWLILTVTFEICLGRFVLGYPWQRIAADYNLFQGGLMALGLVLLILAPFIAAKIRGVWPSANPSG